MSKELVEALDKAAKIAAAADKRAKKDALYMMWALKRMGEPRPNIPFLAECCGRMKHALTQMTAGQPQYRKSGDVEWGAESDQLINMIIVESFDLWRSGKLDGVEEPEDEVPVPCDPRGTFDFMNPGKIKSNAPVLAELCETFDRMMSGKRRPDEKMTPAEVENAIVVEAMCLWNSGNLEKLKEVHND